jgi:hypothetical protein
VELKYRDEVENEIIDLLEKIGLENVSISHGIVGGDLITRRGYILINYDERLRK